MRASKIKRIRKKLKNEKFLNKIYDKLLKEAACINRAYSIMKPCRAQLSNYKRDIRNSKRMMYISNRINKLQDEQGQRK